MKATLLLLFPFLFIKGLNAQLEGVVIDSSTKKPIAFVNIWKKGGRVGATSNNHGVFMLENVEEKPVVFSTLGYKTKIIPYGTIGDTVAMVSEVMKLPGVVLNASKKRKKKIRVSKIKKSRIGHYLPGFSDQYLRKYSRYFTYEERFENTPFIDAVEIATRTDRDMPFRIKFQDRNDDGTPGYFLHNKDIIVMAKNGNKVIRIQLSDLNLAFPKNGLFVTVEWLHIESNLEAFKSFGPYIGFTQESTDENSWEHKNSEWSTVKPYVGVRKDFKNKYKRLAMGLKLSN